MQMMASISCNRFAGSSLHNCEEGMAANAGHSHGIGRAARCFWCMLTCILSVEDLAASKQHMRKPKRATSKNPRWLPTSCTVPYIQCVLYFANLNKLKQPPAHSVRYGTLPTVRTGLMMHPLVRPSVELFSSRDGMCPQASHPWLDLETPRSRRSFSHRTHNAATHPRQRFSCLLVRFLAFRAGQTFVLCLYSCRLFYATCS